MPRLASNHPLSPTLYLRRNLGRTIPLMLVIICSVLLIAGIVSMIDSITYSIRTIYSYSQRFVAVSPRGDPSVTPEVRERFRSSCPVPIGRIVTVRATDCVVRSIVGKWPFAVLGLEQDDIRYYLHEMKTNSVEGHVPGPDEEGCIISEPVARNLNKHIGDAFLAPDQQDGYSPNKVVVVGIAHTDKWFALAPVEYLRSYHFPPVDGLIVFAKTPQEQPALDAWAVKEFKGEHTRVFSYAQLDKDTNEMFSILYKVLNVVIGMLVLVITFMMGMLMNIYQSQRQQEFGLLQALGFTKRQLLIRVVVETFLVIIGGWALGLVAANMILRVVKHTVMDPQAFAIDIFDPVAYAYTIPIPIMIVLAAGLTVSLRFRKFDPVGIVERRLV